MRRLIGIVLAVAVLFLVLYVAFIYDKESAMNEKKLEVSNKEEPGKVQEKNDVDIETALYNDKGGRVEKNQPYVKKKDRLSIREIDSLSANENIDFTIKNSPANMSEKESPAAQQDTGLVTLER